MARIIFLPDDQTVIMLESPLNAEDLEGRVTRGEWSPPPPYAQASPAANQALFRALVVGQLVVVIPYQTQAVIPQSRRARKVSPRQMEVLQLLAEGLTTKEIAAALGLSTRTVMMHIRALKTRFGTVTREQAVMRATSLGIYADSPKKPSDPS